MQRKLVTNCIIKDKNSTNQFELGGVEKGNQLISANNGDFIAYEYQAEDGTTKLCVEVVQIDELQTGLTTMAQFRFAVLNEYEILEK